MLALGGGFEIALRFISRPPARPAHSGPSPEANSGLMPESGAQTLSRIIGKSRWAKELIWTAAAQGRRSAPICAIVNHVAPPGKAMGEIA